MPRWKPPSSPPTARARLEDIYLPFKPKRRTKAEIAKEAGLEPLAELLLTQPENDPKVVAETVRRCREAGGRCRCRARRRARHSGRALRRGRRPDRRVARADVVKRPAWPPRCARARRPRARSSTTISNSAEPLTKLPSHRILAMFRGEKEEILDLQMLPEPSRRHAGAPVSSHEMKIMQRFAISDQGRPGDQWLVETVRWAWRTKIQVHLNIDLRMRLWNAAEQEAVRVFASNLRDLLLAAPAGARVTMGLDPGFRTGVKVAVVDATGKVVATTAIYPHEPQRRWDEALATLGKLAVAASRRPDRDRQRHRLARDRQARHGSGQAAAGTEDVEDRGVGSRRVGLFGLGLRLGGIAGTRRHPARRGLDRAAAAGSAGRAGQDRSQGDRRRPVPARPRREQAGALARCRGRRLRQRGRRRRQHRLGAAAGAGVGHRLRAGAKHRAAPRRQRPVQVAQGAEGSAAARPEGVRAMRRLPAHPRRRRSARRLRRASGSLSGGAQDSGRDQERHQGADRQCRDRAPAEAADLRRRHLWSADGDRHPARTGKARPRSAPGLQGRGVQGGRRDAEAISRRA